MVALSYPIKKKRPVACALLLKNKIEKKNVVVRHIHAPNRAGTADTHAPKRFGCLSLYGRQDKIHISNLFMDTHIYIYLTYSIWNVHYHPTLLFM